MPATVKSKRHWCYFKQFTLMASTRLPVINQPVFGLTEKLVVINRMCVTIFNYVTWNYYTILKCHNRKLLNRLDPRQENVYFNKRHTTLLNITYVQWWICLFINKCDLLRYWARKYIESYFIWNIEILCINSYSTIF